MMSFPQIPGTNGCFFIMDHNSSDTYPRICPKCVGKKSHEFLLRMTNSFLGNCKLNRACIQINEIYNKKAVTQFIVQFNKIYIYLEDQSFCSRYSLCEHFYLHVSFKS